MRVSAVLPGNRAHAMEDVLGTALALSWNETNTVISWGAPTVLGHTVELSRLAFPFFTSPLHLRVLSHTSRNEANLSSINPHDRLLQFISKRSRIRSTLIYMLQKTLSL